MSVAQYDVVVVGAGCAGLTAAIGLARAGFAVALVEAAPMVGGANGLGDVCFADSLMQPDILGAEGVEALAWERRLIERGSFGTDGRRLAGWRYRDPDAFRQCYTILRPLFDAHLAQLALQQRVALLTATTAECLIRDGRRVIGVATSRGPLYSELVFLAEGDAGHLVTREALDRASDTAYAPAFLYCLQQVIELPPGVIEECFHVGPEQGIAYDFLLRNPAGTRWNVRGFLTTNRQGLTLSVVLPARNLRRQLHGEPRQILDWFVDMPVLRPWLRDGRRGAWSATLLRAGGLRDVPYLVEDGLAIGGAAAGLGVDFPSLNFTGPATATGLFVSRAAMRIRDDGGTFDRAALSRHYLGPLQQTAYWRNMEFLQRWPGYARKTHLLFNQGLDLVLDSAAVWAREHRWLPRKLLDWLRVLARVPWRHWDRLLGELLHLGRALRLRDVTPRPALARILLDGALNAFRDLVRQPRANLPPSGKLRLHFYSTDEPGRAAAVPRLLRRWFQRFRPVLSSAGHIFYANEDRPLSRKLTAIFQLLVRQINLLDLLIAVGLGLLLTPTWLALATLGYVFRGWRKPSEADVHQANRQGKPAHAGSAGPVLPTIRLLWKHTAPTQQAESVRDLPHICPAGVFTVQGAPPEMVQVRVQAERCISCEACWRLNPIVDWGRKGAAPLLSAVLSPVVTRLLKAQDEAAAIQPFAPRCIDPWKAADHECIPPIAAEKQRELGSLLKQLEQTLHEFERALAKESALVDRPRGDHLEMLTRSAQNLALRVREILGQPSGAIGSQAVTLADDLAARTEKRARRTWDGKFAWAFADGLLLRQHHLLGLSRLLGIADSQVVAPTEDSAALRMDWLDPALASRSVDACLKHLLADLAARHYVLNTLEQVRIPQEEAIRTDLCAALSADLREGLLSRTAELDAHLGGKQTRFGGQSTGLEAYRRVGNRWLADIGQLSAILAVPGDWPTLEQRRVLLAERQEIEAAEGRLLALATDCCVTEETRANQDESSAGFARQAAHIVAGKWLLLRTFARLEKGLDAELPIVLLRVWLDYAATLLDEFTIALREQARPALRIAERPLVEPGSDPPLRTKEEYLAAMHSYASGDFLLVSIDLLRSRLVPEMLSREEVAAILSEYGVPQSTRLRYLAETLAVEMIEPGSPSPSDSFPLEMASSRLILAEIRQAGSALSERCVILRALAEEALPRLRGDGDAAMIHHLERDVLELEAFKAGFRRALAAVGQLYDTALGHNPDVQASCFALAEAAAWLKAADSTLGRLAWLSRVSQAEEREEPAEQQERGRLVLRHCYAEIRDRLFRFQEDLASLRRGYYAPHVRAATLLLVPQPAPPPESPVSAIHRPLHVLVVVEPLPAGEDGERVLESHWQLSDADRAAVENALRLRDVAADEVSIEAIALGPPRVASFLREILSLGIAPVHLAVMDREDVTLERAVASLVAQREHAGPVDLILGGAHPGNRLAPSLAGALSVPYGGHAASIAVRATAATASAQLCSATAQPLRERPLPILVLIEAGVPLRPFSLAGYLAGLSQRVQRIES
jgi:flavin-dependent dehydrogenase